MNALIAEACRRLHHILGLSPEVAARAVAEIIDSFRFGVDEYIAVRHAELQGMGINNPEIYERIAAELPSLRFAAPALTPRQIRRRIYG
ncbi:MAG: hypothetical protein ACOY0T_17800 [Myxococcota bacterium]